MTNWSRLLNTAINNYIKGALNNVDKRRRLLSALKKRGKIVKKEHGLLLEFKVRHSQQGLFPADDMDQFDFPRHNKWETAQLGWTALAMTEAISKYETLVNGGNQAIVNLVTQATETLRSDFEDKFCDELYLDQSVTANLKHLIGLKSALANSGASSNGYIADANDTYAGLVTNLANYGGTWTGNWPAGYGDAIYHFWTPLIVDYTDTLWSAATKTWPNTCVEAMRYGLINMNKRANDIDFIILDPDLFYQWLNTQDSKERAQVLRADKGEVYFGYGHEVQYFDGVPVTWEHGVPQGEGFGLKMEEIELHSMQEQLFVMQPVDWDIKSQTKRMVMDFYGQLKFNPRHLLHFAAVTT